MIRFNPNNKDSLTYGEIGDPAMSITDPVEAKKYLDDYTDWLVPRLDKKEREAILKIASEGGNIDVDQMMRLKAEEIARHNLGYWSGYYSHEIRDRFHKVFDVDHPIFGRKFPTAKEAFEMGKNFANQNL
jgi:hypothetical protein